MDGLRMGDWIGNSEKMNALLIGDRVFVEPPVTTAGAFHNTDFWMAGVWD